MLTALKHPTSLWVIGVAIVSIAAIAIFRGDRDNTDTIIVIAGLATALIKIQEVHLVLNSRLDEWKAETKVSKVEAVTAARAQGRLEGTDGKRD